MRAEIEANVFARSGERIQTTWIEIDNSGHHQKITLEYTRNGKPESLSVEGELQRGGVNQLVNFFGRLIVSSKTVGV